MIDRILSRHIWTVCAVLCVTAGAGGYLLFQNAAGAAAAAAVTALALTRTDDWRRRRQRRIRYDADTGVMHGYHRDLSPTKTYPMRRLRPNG